jgi:hypothetical protein
LVKYEYECAGRLVLFGGWKFFKGECVNLKGEQITVKQKSASIA